MSTVVEQFEHLRKNAIASGYRGLRKFSIGLVYSCVTFLQQCDNCESC